MKMEQIKLTNIKLIVSDLDGTLLNNAKQIDDQFLTLIQELQKQNINFTLCSGRNMHIMQELVTQCNITIPYISNNGANMYMNDVCIYEKQINTTDLQNFIILMQKHAVPLIAYANTAVFSIGTNARLQKFKERLQKKCEIIESADINEILEQAIFKIVVFYDENIENIQQAVRVTCVDSQFVRSEEHMYSFTHKEATKGETLLKLMNIMHITSDQVLVFGDDFNDQSMFEVAAYSVAMGNADEAVKVKANYTTLSNEEHGVSRFIKEYVI